MAHFLEGVAVAVPQAVAELDDLPLPVGEALEDLGDPVAKHLLGGPHGRVLRPGVGEKVAEVAVLAVADGAIEADWVAAHRRHAPRLIDGGACAGSDLLDRRLAPVLLEELAGDIADPRHRLNHVHRDADRPALVGHRPGDRLPDPPRRVGAKLEPATVFELVDRPHQTGIPLLNEIEERETAVAVLLGDRHDEPEIPLRQTALRLLVVGVDLLDLTDPPLEALRSLLAGLEDHPIFIDEFLTTGRRLLALLVSVDFQPQFLDAADELLKRRDHRLDPLRPQAELFDQPHAPATTATEPGPRLAALQHLPLLREGDPVVGLVLLEENVERPEVVGETTEDLILLQTVGHRHLDGAVKGELATVDAGQHLE